MLGAKEVSESKTKPPQKSRWSIIFLLVLVAGFFGLAAIFFIQYQRLQLKLNALDKEIGVVSEQQNVQASNAQKTQSQLIQLQKKIDSDKINWAVTQAKHLSGLASIELTYQHNIPGALDLLQAANKQIAGIKDLGYNRLQKNISDNISKLSAFQPMDINSYYLQIQTLDKMIDAIAFSVENQPAPSEEKQDTTIPWWKKFLKTSSTNVKNLLVIEHHPDKIYPLFSMKNQALFKGYLHLLTAQMQTALLQNNSVIFNAALDQFKNALQQQAGIEKASVDSMGKITAALQNIPWQQNWPSLDEETKNYES